MLATDPDFNRRGLGALQLAWGLKIADTLGLETYLEASEVGVGLYERWGFEKLGRLEFESELFGTGKRVEHICMLRPAHHLNGETVNGKAVNGNMETGSRVDGIVANGHAGSKVSVNGVAH